MVDLPRYVTPVKKPNGRLFYYYAKYRGTDRAWPTVRMPDDPLSVEFALRLGHCELLTARNEGGHWMWTFTDAIGQERALPSPRPSDMFWAAVDKAEKIGKQLLGGENKTFAALITAYKDHHAYKKNAEKTRSEYDRYLSLIEAAWGDDPVSSLTSVQAQEAIDAYGDTPAAARFFRAVLSRVVRWGISRGYSTLNPISNTEKISGDGHYEPWADWQFEIWFEYARVGLHLPVFSGLFTGQRSVDVFKMTRPAATATEMPIFAQKTGEYVPVQIHFEYRAIMAATKLRSADTGVVPLHDAPPDYLHLREDCEAWTLAGAKTAWQREMTFEAEPDDPPHLRNKAKAMKRLRDARTVFHGLRKNAVIMLLEVGCTEKEVGKIVGMSPDMVELYSKRVRARKMAISAMKKLEDNWGDIRKSILGNVVQQR